MPATRSTRTAHHGYRKHPRRHCHPFSPLHRDSPLATLATISHADEMQPAGHEANGFDRRYLHEHEARALYEAWYMAPPDFRLPGTWRLSAGGIPIPPVPHGMAWQAAIHRHYYEVLMPEERNDPLRDLDSDDHWMAFFT
jgi:hypothetical protein